MLLKATELLKCIRYLLHSLKSILKYIQNESKKLAMEQKIIVLSQILNQQIEK
jgi:hypothetical protein